MNASPILVLLQTTTFLIKYFRLFNHGAPTPRRLANASFQGDAKSAPGRRPNWMDWEAEAAKGLKKVVAYGIHLRILLDGVNFYLVLHSHFICPKQEKNSRTFQALSL